MKKLLTILITGIMIFSLAACGGNGKTDNDVSNNDTPSVADNTIESMTLVYDIDEKEVTIYKPDSSICSRTPLFRRKKERLVL